jgi:hypothetical protein
MQLAASQQFMNVIRQQPFSASTEGLALNLLPDDFDVSSESQSSPSQSSQSPQSQVLSNLVQSQQQRQQIMDNL